MNKPEFNICSHVRFIRLLYIVKGKPIRRISTKFTGSSKVICKRDKIMLISSIVIYF